ncbi:MAG TPA: tetratricopeptide repeat protein [Candidatus Sulfotelmatobacter sp.]|nr:tetratricopeptide repeat protein [Candidatus Sulfotelmatobacter sp.]
MKLFAALVIAFFLAVPILRAQQSPDDQYVIIYVLIQQGDASLNAGQPKQALGDYVEADRELKQFQLVYSDWNPMIVNYRLNYLAEKITALTPQISTNAPPPKVAPAPTPADWQAQLANLNGQIQQLQGANETLQAKLKEALSVQPEGASAAAYAQLQEQVHELSKENDLLKATAAQMTTNAPSRPAVPQPDPKLQQELADQTTRATQLAQENDSLEAKVLALTTDADAAEALRSENAVLKKELANVHLPAATDTNGDLSAARAQIAQLQADANENWLEKTALERRIQQMQESSLENAVQNTAQDTPDLQAQIHELKLERDTLLAQLGQANRKLKTRKNETASAQLDALAQQIETLRDRVEVDEGETVPYTPQELALFTPEPLAADPKGEKKSFHKLSGSAAVLVAEAQSYFTNREYDKAAADYEAVLSQNESSPLALANLASTELEQNKLSDADAHVQAALALDPNDPFSLAVLGRVRFCEGNLDGALDALDRAVKLDPENPHIENFLGVALAQKGLRVQAETAFRKAVAIDPNYGDAHKNLAIIYLSTVPPMTEMARWHYEKALVAGVPPNPQIEKMLSTTTAANNPGQ